MGIFLPDMAKERKIKTLPIWIGGQRILVDQYSFGYKDVLGEHEQLRCSFIRENAAQNGEGAMRRQRSGYVIFGDEVCRVEDNFPQVGVINKQSGKWVVN